MLMIFATPSYGENLPRVMSLNLCADAYLMAFADKSQIAALTHLSRDEALSSYAEAAQDFPVSDGQIEAIIKLQPDLVIVSSWSDPMRNALIKRLGFDLLTLDAAQNYAAARDEILTLGTAIGRASEAKTYLKQLDETLAAHQISAKKLIADRPKVLPLQRRNLTVGDGHILDEIIKLAGAENIGAELARSMGHISLETALTAKADFILLSEAADKADSRGMEFITHPALKSAYPTNRQLHIPHNLLVCSGATTPRAVGLLIAQLTTASRQAPIQARAHGASSQ